MSYPYPQDRHLDRKEKGEQPYKDAKEEIARQDAAQPTEAHERGQEPPRLSSLSQDGDEVPVEVLEQLHRSTGEEATD